MRLLYITSRLPYPPLKGDQVRGYHHLRLLHKTHQITLISFVEQNAVNDQAINVLNGFCKKIVTVPLPRIKMAFGLIKVLSSKYPIQTSIYQSSKMCAVIASETAQDNFDLVHVQLARMAPYFEKVTAMPRIIDIIDALSVNMERRYKREHGVMKMVTWFEWQRMKTYERLICTQFDQATVVSEKDQAAIGEFQNLLVNKNGVDLDRFRFVPVSDPARLPDQIVFSGNMGYFPNIDAVLWFANKVFPKIQTQRPSVRFDVFGISPPPSVLALAQNNSAIHIAGHVDNVQERLARATLSVAPMQAGSGMQFKVIEAMACGTPIVITPFALGGLDVVNGKHLSIAQSADEFVQAVIDLLTNPTARETLSVNGRKLVEEQFSWECNVAQLEDVYHLAVQAHRETNKNIKHQ